MNMQNMGQNPSQSNIVVLGHDGQAITSSLALSDGTGNQHEGVIKLVRQNLADLESFGGVRFQIAPFETNGGTQNREVALLNEPQATLVMTYFRNSDVVKVFKLRLVTAFYEMAGRLKNAHLPKSFAESLRLLADETEKTQALQAQAVIDAPKAAAYDRAIDATGLVNLTEAAKMLGQRPRKFNQWLSAGSYIYRRPGGKSWIAYQPKIQSGLLDHKTHIQSMEDGTERVRDQVMVTSKGLMHFAKKLGVELPKEDAA